MQDNRSAFQNAMQHKFVAEVQRLSGRRVLNFISSHHVGPDLEIELFFPRRHQRSTNPTLTQSAPRCYRFASERQCLTMMLWSLRAALQSRK